MSVVAFTAGSLGDILATAGLAAQVVKVLYDNKSLSKECDILAIELRSLQSTLIMVEFALQRYGSTPLGEPLAHFAKPEVAQCYLALKVFEERIVACQQALSLTGIASLWRKIVWALSDETAVLNSKLAHHRVKLVTLLMVLNSVGWMDSGNQSNYLTEGRMYTGNRCCSRSMHGVKDHTIEVVDPLGETIPIPILFCVTWEAFDHVLKGYSKGRIGEHYIQQGDYQIIASGIDRVIDRSKLSQVQVGERIEMSIVLRSRKGVRDNLGRCPRCSYLNTVVSSKPGSWTRCLQCSGLFHVDNVWSNGPQATPAREISARDSGPSSDKNPTARNALKSTPTGFDHKIKLRRRDESDAKYFRRITVEIHPDGHWEDIVIEDKLFMGSIVGARSSRYLNQKKVTHILSVCTDPVPGESPESGFVHMRIPVEDTNNTNLLTHLPAACDFIDRALRSGGVVFVHSVHGISRGPAVVAAYLMWSRRIQLTEALKVIRYGHPRMWPQDGFMGQLMVFELCGYAPPESTENGTYKWPDSATNEESVKLSVPSTVDPACG